MIFLSRAKAINILLFVVSVVSCLWPTFVNGYPLLLSETAIYVLTGHLGEVPVDRSIGYSLFVRNISLSWSLWAVVLIQSLLFNYLIWLLVKYTLKAKKPFLIHFFIVLFLITFTSISVYCSAVIEYIFTPISILSLFLLVTIPKNEQIHLGSLVIIFIYSTLVSYSHIVLHTILILLFIIFHFIFKRTYVDKLLKRLLIMLVSVGVSVLLLITINWSFGGEFKLFRNHSIVLFAKYLNQGIVKKAIDKKCNSTDEQSFLTICKKEQYFNSAEAGHFLWHEDSPLYEGNCSASGWTVCWDEKKELYSQLNDEILSDTELRVDVIATSLTGTTKQLLLFHPPNFTSVNFESHIKRYLPSDLYAYKNAKQNQSNLKFSDVHLRELILIHLSFYLLLFFIFKYRAKIDGSIKLITIFVFIVLVLNAFVNASLLPIFAMKQGSIIFLLPLVLLLCLLDYAKKDNKWKTIKLSDLL